MAIGLGEALISLIGGGLQGYTQGRKYKAVQQTAAKERERQRAAEERIFEQRQNKINEQIAGRKEAFGLLNSVSGLSPQTPASEIMKLKTQYLDAADRAGINANEAIKLFDEAVITQPAGMSELDKLNLDLKRAQIERQKALTTKAKRPSASTGGGGSTELKEVEKRINVVEEEIKALQNARGKVNLADQPKFERLQQQLDTLRSKRANLLGIDLPTRQQTQKEVINRQVQRIIDESAGKLGDPEKIEELKQQDQSPNQTQYPTATNPKTGEKLIYINGQWQKIN